MRSNLSKALEVLLGLFDKDAEGNFMYTWKSKEEIERIAAIARAALADTEDRRAARAVGCTVRYYRKYLKQ
jgi:hypothetical protein